LGRPNHGFRVAYYQVMSPNTYWRVATTSTLSPFKRMLSPVRLHLSPCFLSRSPSDVVGRHPKSFRSPSHLDSRRAIFCASPSLRRVADRHVRCRLRSRGCRRSSVGSPCRREHPVVAVPLALVAMLLNPSPTTHLSSPLVTASSPRRSPKSPFLVRQSPPTARTSRRLRNFISRPPQVAGYANGWSPLPTPRCRQGRRC
jgi:hypothetical protein